MRRLFLFTYQAFLGVIGLSYLPGASAAEQLSHGRFANVSIYRPAGEVRQFVLLLSGVEAGQGDDLGEVAKKLAVGGALVASIDTGQLIAAFIKDKGSCFFPDGDLENLSHYIQAYYKLPAYLVPVLVGYSAGATVAYGMATQAAQDIFTGAVLIGYHSRLTLKLPLCKPDKDDPAQRIPLATRLARVQFVDALEHGNSMPQLEASYAHVAALRPPAIHPPASLADLPVVEVPAESNSDLFAVFVSGDGGWAGIDKSVAASLAARGIPVVGIDSLRYFWSERTPAGLASDLGRVLSYYSARWNKQRALLIGFSQGADVLPFAVNRLAPGPQRMVTLAVFMSLSSNADFEFHLSNWISSGNGGRSVLPEVARLHDPPGLCIYGADDEDTICPRIHNPAVKVLELEGGHHFDGEYDKVADLILKAADEADAPRNPRS